MNRIRELRKSRGLNQTELARELSVSQGTLSYWENEDFEPDTKSIIKLANYFDVTTDYLLNVTNIQTTFEMNLAEDEIDLLSMYRTFDTKTRADMFDLINFTYKKQQGIEKSLFSTYGKGKDEQVINTKKINVR